MKETLKSPFLYKTSPSRQGSNSDIRVKSSQGRVFGIMSGNNEVDVGELGLYSSFAFRAHMGTDWKEGKYKRAQHYLSHQLFGGRSMEVLICEQMIQQHPGFHFLPTQEMDLNYKTDMVSRMPYRSISKLRGSTKLKTLAIGSQLTLLKIPENIKGTHREAQIGRRRYHDKIEQVRIMASFLDNPITRKDIKQRFGKINLPDVLSFVAVNGELRKTLGNASDYTFRQFKEWENSGFESDQLLDHFKQRLQQRVKDVASFIAWSQEYILSQEFLFNQGAAKGKGYKKIYNDTISVEFSSTTRELELQLKNPNNNEIIVQITYFLVGNTIKKLASKAGKIGNCKT